MRKKTVKSKPAPALQRLLRVDMTEIEVLTMLRLSSVGAAMQQVILAGSGGDLEALAGAVRTSRRAIDAMMEMDRDEIVAWNEFVTKLNEGVFVAFGITGVALPGTQYDG